MTDILSRLEHVSPSPAWNPSGKPVDELVATILSQNTSDTNTERAFSSLRNRFPRWYDVVCAPIDDVVSAIQVGGLATQKAPRIQQVLRELVRPDDSDPNRTLLRQLTTMTPEEALASLTRHAGVGPKTAACVLLFAVGMPVIPVDTHVFRVSRRIGLFGSETSAEKAHSVLGSMVSPENAYRFHVQLIRHGRTVCKARKPRCSDCVLVDLCDYGSSARADT